MCDVRSIAEVCEYIVGTYCRRTYALERRRKRTRFEEAVVFRADYLRRYGADRLLRAAAEMGREAQSRREEVLQRNMRHAFELARRFTI